MLITLRVFPSAILYSYVGCIGGCDDMLIELLNVNTFQRNDDDGIVTLFFI